MPTKSSSVMFLPRTDGEVIADVLARHAAATPDKPFARFPDHADFTYTYAELKLLAERAAYALHSVGTTPGDRVAIVLPNGPQMLNAWFACLVGGFVDAAISPELRGASLQYAIVKVEASTVITDAEHLDDVLAALPAGGQIQVLCFPGESGALPALGPNVHDLSELIQTAEARDLRPTRFDALTSIKFTSGTTGMPKGIMLSSGHMRASAQMACVLTGLTADETIYTPFPLHHGLASIAGVLAALEAGATVAIAYKFSASRFWPHVRMCGATVTQSRDPSIAILSKADPTPQDADNTVRCMYMAASEFNEFSERFGVKLIRLFDLTELTVLAHYRPGDVHRPGSCGRESDLFHVAIVDEHDRPVAAGTVGELVVRPKVPNVMMLGYYADEEKTVQQWRNLWFHTGDTATLDEDGYLYFKGRSADRIRHRGVNVSPEQVEAEAAAHPAVAASAAIAIPTGVMDDEVKLCVELRPGVEVTAEELGDQLHGIMSRHHRPRYVEIYSPLPLTDTQKIRKGMLRTDGKNGLTSRTWDVQERRWTTP